MLQSINQLIYPILIVFSSLLTRTSAQEFLWAKGAGGTDEDVSNSVTTDLEGNVYLTGSFASSSITFGDFTLTNQDENKNLFIVKMNSVGEYIWAQGIEGSTGENSIMSVTTDSGNNIYFTGLFRSTTLTCGDLTISNSGDYDVFIVKMDKDGNYLWAKSAGGSLRDDGRSITIDNEGNIYLTGMFTSYSITFGNTTLTNAGADDIFIVKMNNAGDYIWAMSAGGTSWDEGEAVTTDIAGNVFLTGEFMSSSITFDDIILSNSGSRDIFIVKMNSSGEYLWAQSANGSGIDWARSITTDLTGNVYISGYFNSDSITFSEFTLTNSGNYDILIAKLNSNGEYIWAKCAGGSAEDRAWAITTDIAGNIYFTGYSHYGITFGSFNLSGSGYADTYIAKINNSGEYIYAVSAECPSTDMGYAITTDSNENVYVSGYFYYSSISFRDYTLSNSGNYDVYITKVGDDPVPVELTSFSAELKGSSVKLNWHTATEVNNYGFEVERSTYRQSGITPGQDWEQIGFVPGHGNCNASNDYEYVDITAPAEILEYRLKQIDTDGTFEYYIPTVKVDARNITGVEANKLPTEFELNQNYPNPFNPVTKLTYSIPQKGYVQIKVYDILGNEIRTLVNAKKQVGTHTVEFNAANLSSGIYIYEMISGNYCIIKKMVLLK